MISTAIQSRSLVRTARGSSPRHSWCAGNIAVPIARPYALATRTARAARFRSGYGRHAPVRRHGLVDAGQLSGPSNGCSTAQGQERARRPAELTPRFRQCSRSMARAGARPQSTASTNRERAVAAAASITPHAQHPLDHLLDALQVGTPEGMARTRNLQHHAHRAADRNRNHGRCSNSATAVRKPHGQGIFGRSVGGAQDRSSEPRHLQHQVLFRQGTAESIAGHGTYDAAGYHGACRRLDAMQYGALAPHGNASRVRELVKELVFVSDAPRLERKLQEGFSSYCFRWTTHQALQGRDFPNEIQLAPMAARKSHVAMRRHVPGLYVVHQLSRDDGPNRPFAIGHVPKRRRPWRKDALGDVMKLHGLPSSSNAVGELSPYARSLGQQSGASVRVRIGSSPPHFDRSPSVSQEPRAPARPRGRYPAS